MGGKRERFMVGIGEGYGLEKGKGYGKKSGRVLVG